MKKKTIFNKIISAISKLRLFSVSDKPCKKNGNDAENSCQDKKLSEKLQPNKWWKNIKEKIKFKYKTYLINLKIKKMKQLLDSILLELKKTKNQDITEFTIFNNYATFKFFGSEFYIKENIGRVGKKEIIGRLTLFQNTQNSFPPNPPTLEKIKDFDLFVYSKGRMSIKNYIDIDQNNLKYPTLIEGEMPLDLDNISYMYFEQLDEKIIKEDIRLWL